MTTLGRVIFWGATGQAKVLREALSGSVELVAIFDNRTIASPFPDIPIFHGEAGLAYWQSSCRELPQAGACVAIGGMRGRDRLELLDRLADFGYEPVTVLHPRAFVAAGAKLGRGCQILALGAVCAGATLGDAVIINTAASIDHDCVIGHGVHVAPGATLAGEVTVGDFAFIGTGATVLPHLRIGVGAVVGAGAVVTRNVADGATVFGNPARPRARAIP